MYEILLQNASYADFFVDNMFSVEPEILSTLSRLSVKSIKTMNNVTSKIAEFIYDRLMKTMFSIKLNQMFKIPAVYY